LNGKGNENGNGNSFHAKARSNGGDEKALVGGAFNSICLADLQRAPTITCLSRFPSLLRAFA
jgi:hypothetical protein